jgi:hypothetical protein
MLQMLHASVCDHQRYYAQERVLRATGTILSRHELRITFQRHTLAEISDKNDGKKEVHNELLNVLLHDKPHTGGDDTIDLNEPMALALSRRKLGSWQV